jgi:hypothetical protein
VTAAGRTLRASRTRYDPGNVFRLNHHVEPVKTLPHCYPQCVDNYVE